MGRGTGRVKAREDERRAGEAGGKGGHEKKIRYTGLRQLFPQPVDGGTRGRAALNRFGRVIAIPPLRFHATFVATSADLPLSPSFSFRDRVSSSAFRPASHKILQPYKNNK